jgi:integrase
VDQAARRPEAADTWLGHASVQTTLDVYGHLIRDEHGDAAIVAATEAELSA